MVPWLCPGGADPGGTTSRPSCADGVGGPLEEGTISDGCVICPWHGSTFRFADGSIVRGPASTPEPCYQTRIQNEHIEVRAFT
jgi:nitrite reductase/ring-hydroxylating ferredoxin subunit